MIDALKDEYERIGYSAEKLAALEERKHQMINKAKEYEERCGPLLDAIELEGEHFDERTDPEYVRAQYKIDDGHVEALFDYAMFQYSCGKYDAIPHLLRNFYIRLSTNPERIHEARWGILIAEIHMGQFDRALDQSLPDVKKSISDRERDHVFASELHQMYERAALLHYSLFIFFTKENFEKMLRRDTGLF